MLSTKVSAALSSSVWTSQRASPGHQTQTLWSGKLANASNSGWRHLTWTATTSQTSGAQSRDYSITVCYGSSASTESSGVAAHHWQASPCHSGHLPPTVPAEKLRASSRTTATQHTSCFLCYHLAGYTEAWLNGLPDSGTVCTMGSSNSLTLTPKHSTLHCLQQCSVYSVCNVNCTTSNWY